MAHWHAGTNQLIKQELRWRIPGVRRLWVFRQNYGARPYPICIKVEPVSAADAVREIATWLLVRDGFIAADTPCRQHTYGDTWFVWGPISLAGQDSRGAA
jgi:hypothetical protein